MENIGPITTLLKHDIQKMKEDSKLINIPTSVNRIQSEIMKVLKTEHCIEIVLSKKIADILKNRLDNNLFCLEPLDESKGLRRIYVIEKKLHDNVNEFCRLKIHDSKLEEKILIFSDYECIDSIFQKAENKYFNKAKISSVRYNRLKKYFYYKHDFDLVKVKDLKNGKCYVKLIKE